MMDIALTAQVPYSSEFIERRTSYAISIVSSLVFHLTVSGMGVNDVGSTNFYPGCRVVGMEFLINDQGAVLQSSFSPFLSFNGDWKGSRSGNL